MDVLWSRALDAATPPVRAAIEPAVDRIARELALARVRWPEATVSDAAFAATLVAGFAGQKDAAAALGRLRVEDLLLAQWCGTGDPRAIVAFEHVYRDDLDAVLARFRRLSLGDDELRQALRIKLFV